jgi:hypothetical membrane protein
MALAVSNAGRAVPRWALLSAVLAPVSLIACWLVAGLLQPSGYDPIRQTISVLAGGAASHRWIMTLGLYCVATCQILTGAGLSAARRGARTFLVLGGLAGLGVAAFPQPAHGTTTVHLVFATASVILLALWPATIASRRPAHSLFDVRRCQLVTAVFVGMLLWLLVAAQVGGALGIAERVDTAIENAWPLVIVIALRRGSRVAPGRQPGRQIAPA